MKRKKQWTSMTRLCVLLGLILTGMVSFTAWYLNRPLPAASEGVADTGAAVSETGVIFFNIHFAVFIHVISEILL